MIGKYFKTYGGMLLLSWALYSCAQKIEQRVGHEITIEVIGIKDSSTIVGYHFGNQRLILDSCKIVNDKLQLKGDYALEKGVYFLYSPNFYFEFIISDQFFEMKINSELGYKDIEISGSEDNELFAQFQNKMAEVQKQQSDLSQRLTTVTSSDSVSIIKDLERMEVGDADNTYLPVMKEIEGEQDKKVKIEKIINFFFKLCL